MTQTEILKRLTEIKTTLSDGFAAEGVDRQWLCEEASYKVGNLITNIEQDNR